MPIFGDEHAVEAETSAVVRVFVRVVSPRTAEIRYDWIARPDGINVGSAQQTTKRSSDAVSSSAVGSFGCPTTIDGASLGPGPAAFVAETETT